MLEIIERRYMKYEADSTMAEWRQKELKESLKHYQNAKYADYQNLRELN